LFIRSRKAVAKAKLPTTTKYSTIFSSNLVAWTLIILASALIVGVFVDAYRSFAPADTMGQDNGTPAVTDTESNLYPDDDVSYPAEDDFIFF
jgi:hypothetical protein